MDFYTVISEYYDNIFPYNHNHFEFTKAQLATVKSTILDIGCASGNLAISLAQDGNKVTAIDSDAAMIAKALQKQSSGNPLFLEGDILALQQNFSAAEFDAVLCFGNTLVHLASVDQVKQFITEAHAVLKSGGMLLLQILNYEYILREKITELPLIDNEHVTFKRNYDIKNQDKVDFITECIIKSKGISLKNSIPLLPLTKTALLQILSERCFSEIHFFGDFKMHTLQPNSLPLVVVARK